MLRAGQKPVLTAVQIVSCLKYFSTNQAASLEESFKKKKKISERFQEAAGGLVPVQQVTKQNIGIFTVCGAMENKTQQHLQLCFHVI